MRSGGFSLIELVIAAALGTLALAAAVSMITPVVQEQASSARGQTSLLGAAAAQRTVERDLRQATVVTRPAAAETADVLEGCSNAGRDGSGALAPIAAGEPMRWFAFCAADGLIHRHSGPGCPAPAYTCGESAAFSFGGGRAPRAQASFSRPSARSAMVESSLTLASGDVETTLHGGAAFLAAAGANQ